MLRQPRTVWSIAFACVISFMGIGLVAPILKPIAEELGAGPAEVSLLFTSYMAVMGVAMLGTGWLSTRLGAKRTLLIGLGLVVAWIFYEAKVARHPMVPSELFRGQRVIALAYAVAFVAGMNFFSLLNFWPLTIANVWYPDPVQIGLRGMPIALSTAIGAVFWTGLLSFWKGCSRWALATAAAMLHSLSKITT